MLIPALLCIIVVIIIIFVVIVICVSRLSMSIVLLACYHIVRYWRIKKALAPGSEPAMVRIIKIIISIIKIAIAIINIIIAIINIIIAVIIIIIAFFIVIIIILLPGGGSFASTEAICAGCFTCRSRSHNPHSLSSPS